MTTLGGVVSTPTTATPTPVTTREIVPPFAVKFTLPVAVDADVGLNRTVTAWLAPAPTRENAPPDTTLNGAVVVTAPDTPPPPVFDTVNV